MKRVYWRPSGVSANVMLLIAAISLAGLVVVENLQIRTTEVYYQQMMEASALARDAMDVLKKERQRKGIELHPIADPTLSGLIGLSMSDVTTNTGSLPAKQTSINPNWAAVIVHLLKEAGVQEGETVAVGASGSFPALNVAAYAAIETLRLKPIIISSVSASQWGANHPRFLWVDMERTLQRRKVFSSRSTALTLGGVEDRAAGMPAQAVELLRAAAKRVRLPLLEPENYAESVVMRMATYRENRKDAPLRCYINIGGSTASVGTKRTKYEFMPGLNRRKPIGAAVRDSVMARFLDDRIPVIHLVNIMELAQRYGLPVQPLTPQEVGTGQIFAQRQYNRWLASATLAAVIGSLFLFVRSGRARLAFQRSQRAETGQIEPSV